MELDLQTLNLRHYTKYLRNFKDTFSLVLKKAKRTLRFRIFSVELSTGEHCALRKKTKNNAVKVALASQNERNMVLIR